MANIDNAYAVERLSLNDKVLIVDGNFDPSTGAGYEAPVGSLFLRSDTGLTYQKIGPNDTDWTLVGGVNFSPDNVIYVSKNGSDTTGDGTFFNPFLTIKKGVQTALARVAITPTRTTVKAFSGTYDEVNPITISGTNCEYVFIEGDTEFTTTVQPTVATQPLFDLYSNNATFGPSLLTMVISGYSLPAFKTNNQAAIKLTGTGRFVVNKVEVFGAGIGIDSGNGTSTNQEAVYDFGTIQDCNVGVDAKGTGLQAMQVAYLRNNAIGIKASGDVRVEIGNFSVQGSNMGQPVSGVGFEVNDNSVVAATSGTVTNLSTGIVSNDNSDSELYTTIFENNTTDLNQVDSTAKLVINGRLNKESLVITNGANVSLSYVDEDTKDYIVGSADSTGDPGKEFRVRDLDGRIAVGDNATNANIATGGVGGSRTLNLIDTNGNIRVWRFVADGGQDPAFEWIKGVNPANPDDFGDAPVTSIVAATNTITIDVSDVVFGDPLLEGGIDRTTLAARAFPTGRVFRINGTVSNNGNYTASSATYNSGNQTIDVIVTQDITVSETGVGTAVFGGGAGRTDGVSTYVGDPAGAVGAGVGNVWWDMFLQESDYFVIRRRTGGGGDTLNEKVRVYPDHSEWLGSTTYSDSDNARILYLQTVANAVNYLQINNAITGGGPEIVAVGTDTNVNVEMIPKGTGTVVVPAGYDANITTNSLITRSYFAANIPKKKHLHRHNGAVTQTFTTTPINVLFNTSVRQDTAYSYNAGVVTINEAGWYQITYDVSAILNNNNESNTQAQILLNGGALAGTISYLHHRVAVSGRDTTSATANVNLAVNDTISVSLVRISGTGSLITLANACRLNIQQIDGP